MAVIQWIKLSVGMFEDEKIKLIEAMPEHDTLLIIWIKLLIWAGKNNAQGAVSVSGDLTLSDEAMASILGRPINTVREALKCFTRLKMLELIDDKTLYITNWEKHQNIEGLEKIRIQGTIRQAKHRLLFLPEAKPENSNVTDNVKSHDSNVTDTLRHDIEEEEDKKKNRIDNTNNKDFILPGWIDERTWEDFLDMRKKMRKPATDRAKTLLVKMLEGFRDLGQDPNKIIEQSIVNSWQSLYEIKGGTHGTVQRNPGKGQGRELPREYISPEEADRRRAAARQVGS